MTRSIASARTPVEAAEAVATAASSVLGAALTRIWIEGEEADVLHPAFEWGAAAELDASAGVVPIRVGTGVVGRIYASRAAEYRSDIQTDREVLNMRFVREAGLHAFGGLPLVARDRIHGVVSFLFSERRDFTTEEKELMTLLADSVAIALERARAERIFPAA